jgi:S-(hydroxymethyl)glutathione dehydrogenase / alcohol dehydrogenase
MRAAVMLEVGQPLSVEELTPLDPGPRDVVVRLGASGICHSDLSIAHGTFPCPCPSILGHEGAGRVEFVGAEVTRVRPGDRVIGAPVAACGHCWFCIRDEAHLCRELSMSRSVPRSARADGTAVPAMCGLGTFADEMVCNELSLVRLETDLPDEQLSILGCGVTTGVGSVLNTAHVEPGASVAVIGCGGVGQSAIQGARIAGAGQIIAIDTVALKRETAATMGATDMVDPSEADPVEQVRALTGGRGVDYAFEVIGNLTTMVQAVSMARRGGAAVWVGAPAADAVVSLSAIDVFYEEKRILGCLFGSSQPRREWPRLVSFAEQGRLDLSSMISRRFALDEVNDAFQAIEAGEVIRSVILY